MKRRSFLGFLAAFPAAASLGYSKRSLADHLRGAQIRKKLDAQLTVQAPGNRLITPTEYSQKALGLLKKNLASGAR